MRHSSRFFGFPAVSAVMAGAILLAGCASTTAPPAPVMAEAAPSLDAAPLEPATIAADPANLTPVVRYGRYTLVELTPEPAQRDLMRQVVEVVIPPSLGTNVGDALRHVLRRSGYRLCDTADATALYALPLPAAHLHLGPLMLRDALLTLAGPAWDVSVDDGARQVCFRRHATPVPASANPSAAAGAAPRSDETQGADRREVQP